MGNAASAEEGGEDDPLDPFDGIDTLGYRVLGVQPDSPASEAGLVSFLDFLVVCDLEKQSTNESIASPQPALLLIRESTTPCYWDQDRTWNRGKNTMM